MRTCDVCGGNGNGDVTHIETPEGWKMMCESCLEAFYEEGGEEEE